MRATPGTGTAIAGDIQIGAVEIKDQDSAVRADVLDLTNNDALVTAIVDGDGTQVTDFMLGTDFSNVLGAASLIATDGSAALTLGLQILGTDGTNAQILSTNTSGHLNIADGGNVISTDWNGTVPPIGAGTEAAALRVTVATDSTGVLSIDDNGGSLTVDYGSGTFQVGDAGAIINLDASGDVQTDILSVPAPLSTTGSGTEATALRVTVATDSTGVLSVDDNGSAFTVDNAGTFAVQVDGSALTALQLIDDVVHSGDAVLSKYAVVGAVFDDTTPVAVTENQAQSLRMSTERYLYTEIRDAAGNERGATVNAGGNLNVILAANTGVDIGDVDILSIAAGDNNIGNVDIVTVPAPLSSTGGGTEAAALRVTVANDSTGLVSVDDNGGNLSVDWAGTVPPIGAGTEAAALRVTVATDSTGVVSVDDNGSALTVDNAGTFAVQVDGSALTALQLIDNPVIVDDAAFTPATSSVMMAGFEFDDVTPDSVNEGDAGAARMSANRNVYTTIRDSAGNERGMNVDASGNAQVDIAASSATVTTTPAVTGGGTEATAQRVTIANDSTGVLSVDDNGGNLSVDWAGTVPPIGAGTEAAALRVTVATDSTGVLSVDDNGGALTVDGTITANAGTGTFATSNAIVDGWDNTASDGASVSGDVAHDAADAGEPVKIGFKAETSLKGITLVADGDRTNGYADADGVQIVKIGTTGADKISERVANTDGASTAFTNFSAVASTYNYVESISIWNSSATNGYVDFRDGTAGSILWTMAAPTLGGSIMAVPGGIFKTSANTALAFDVSGALTTVYISVSGYQAKV